MARSAGRVDTVEPSGLVVGGLAYPLRPPVAPPPNGDSVLIWPRIATWHEAVVKEGDQVARRQLLARGVTHVYFQANRAIFTGIVLLLGLCMGIGMGAVYKYIPSYFPNDVGVVGGIVGVLGGLGGFLLPILFGYLLALSGLWTTCWLLLLGLSLVCLVWMYRVVQRIMAQAAPEIARDIESPQVARQLTQLARELEDLAGKLKRQGAA